jgi:AmmeMemoRadiSam system protein A
MPQLNLTERDKKFLLRLARESIKYYLEKRDLLTVSTEELKRYSPTLLEKLATFVTLTEYEQLRGCIGHLEAIQPLYQDVIENAVNAAFFDFRFLPLDKKELNLIKIEISILTKPQPLDYQTPEDLINSLRKNIDGVIIKKGPFEATYLPQVWEQIPDKEEFLNSLCVKAGLPSDIWKKEKLEVKIYQVESFKEE